MAEIPPEAERTVEKAHNLRALAAEAKARANELTADAVLALREEGVSYRDIGTILGISHQRAQQIASEPREGA